MSDTKWEIEWARIDNRATLIRKTNLSSTAEGDIICFITPNGRKYANQIAAAPDMRDLLEEVCGDMDCAFNGIETNLEKDKEIWTRILQEDIFKIKQLLAKARVEAKQEEKK